MLKVTFTVTVSVYVCVCVCVCVCVYVCGEVLGLEVVVAGYKGLRPPNFCLSNHFETGAAAPVKHL